MKVLATAQTLDRLEKYVNEFWYSQNYCIDPDTLRICLRRGEESVAGPKGFSVVPYRTGYRFVYDSST